MCYSKRVISLVVSKFCAPIIFLRSFWLMLVGMIFLTSCQHNSRVAKEERMFHASKVSEVDSLVMVEKFEIALRNPEAVDSIIKTAEELLEKQPELEDVYMQGYGRFLILTGQLDLAREHVQSVIEHYGNDTLNLSIAKYYNLMAAIEAYSKNHEESVLHFKRAIKLYEMYGDDRQAAVIKMNLANIFFGRLDYDSAHKYSFEAIKPLEGAKDTANLVLALSVLSVAETNLYKENEAEKYAQYAYRLAQKYPSLQGKLFANYAMGEVELLKDNYEASIEWLEQTVQLGELHQMYQWLLPVRAALQKANLEAGNYLKAVDIGNTLVEQASTFGNRDVMYSAMKNLAFAQEKLGCYQKAFTNLKEAEELFREQMSETTERVLQETLAKYEMEKKNNLILQQENKLSKQQMWGVILIGSALLIISTLIWIWESTKQKNKLLIKEKENAVYYAINEGEEKERKRLAGELHDGIASNLVAIKLKIENSDLPSTTLKDLLPLVSKTHEEIRHAAHNLAPLNFEQHNLILALETFAIECSNQSCSVSFQSNDYTAETQLPKHIALIIYRAVQELTQNALKYADASTIDIQLMFQDQKLTISVEDNGKGFDTAVVETKIKGGLNSLIQRLRNIGASIEIESQPNNGTTIFIHLENSRV